MAEGGGGGGESDTGRGLGPPVLALKMEGGVTSQARQRPGKAGKVQEGESPSAPGKEFSLLTLI